MCLRKVISFFALLLAFFACSSVRESALAAGASTNLPSGNFKQELENDGLTREFLIHIPAGTKRNAPVLILFHGGGGTARGIEAATHMDMQSDAGGFIAVFPQGYLKHWNDGRTVPARPNTNDVAFVEKIIRYLKTQLYVDPARIYVVGFSDGGLFTNRLTYTITSQIAAAACVCAPQTRILLQMYGPYHPPLPILYMLGTSDPQMKWNGGPMAHGETISADQTVFDSVVANHCDRTPIVTDLPNKCTTDDSRVVRLYFPSPYGETGDDVAFYKVIGGGHRWPGGEIRDSPNLPPLGNTNQDIDASQVIWDFVSRHHKPMGCY